MTDETLEQLLRNLPAPELPDVWRGEILAAARRGAPALARPDNVRPGFLLQVLRLFARHPVSAGALTTLWLVILLLHLATPAEPSSGGLLAGGVSSRPVYFTSIPLEVRLALLDQDQAGAPDKLRP